MCEIHSEFQIINVKIYVKYLNMFSYWLYIKMIFGYINLNKNTNTIKINFTFLLYF